MGRRAASRHARLPPVWGNRLERAIQVEPRSPVLCRFLDQSASEDVQKIDPVPFAQVKAAMEAMPAPTRPAAALSDLQKEPSDDKLHALRLRQRPQHRRDLHRRQVGGAILIAGFLAMPTAANLEYRVMSRCRRPGFQGVDQDFNASITTIIGTTITYSTFSQVAVGDWFTYLPEAGPPVFVSVAGNLLARFTASEEGLHRIFVQFRDPAAPAVVMSTAIHDFRVDDTPPVVDVEITSGAGNCSKFAADGEPSSARSP
jgi:hypothetical protein